MYDFTKRNMHVIDERYDVDHDGWPEGSGNVERPGMGPEKLDNGVYYMRGLYDLADMARAEHDTATVTWATNLADKLRSQFEQTWWDPSVSQYADSLDNPGNTQAYLKNWIDQVPMEATLTQGTQVTPGVASHDHGVAALATRESSCFSGDRPGSRGLFHTACGGGADGAGDFEIFSLTTAIQAVGEGNYGRLGPDHQRRYTDANAETMFSEQATGGTPDEMPGARSRRSSLSWRPIGDPATGIPANINRCWTCRSMVMQAWGNYGTVWPVVSQQLGVRPFIGQSALPGGPAGAQRPAERRRIEHPPRFRRRVDRRVRRALGQPLHDEADPQPSSGCDPVQIGQTLRRRVTASASVTLDGRAVHGAQVRDTNRGVEVTVPVTGAGPHTLRVNAA